MNGTPYTTLFLDVGGVFLTNGWDHSMRERAAKLFNLDAVEMNKRHALTFDTYEIGKISLDVYLDRIVFYEPRNFTREKFKEFMFDQSQPHPKMIELFLDLKHRFDFKIVVVSNEGRELMINRINRFNLKEFVDVFICSCFVQLRKPDEEIFRLAFDIAQANPKEVIYIDDRLMLVEIGRQLGMTALQHTTFENTQQQLMDLLSASSMRG